MRINLFIFVPIWGLCALCATRSQAQLSVRDMNAPPEESTRFVLPYVFSSETFGFSVGAAAMASGIWQDQATFYGTAFVGDNDSYRLLGGAFDLRVPQTERLFVSPYVQVTKYGDVHAYISGNPAFPNQRPGANDSSPDNYITDSAWDARAHLTFRYVLPMGHGKRHINNRVKLNQGLLQSEPVGGDTWDPLQYGRSYVIIEPFYADQHMERDQGQRSLRSNGLRLEMKHDNTDFILNPSRGSVQRLAVTRDWGLGKSTNPWTQWEVELRKFLSLGASEQFRQRVIAFDAWLSDVPTWELKTSGTTVLVDHRPPYFEGSHLGGFNRMRAFPVNRFHDRSALYYSLEYRVIPQWNPFAKLKRLPVEVKWWQWVVYGEMGRVADDLDLSELHSDLKWDVGIGLRAFSEGGVGRVGIAFAEEGWAALAMFGHPF
jgi:hypothetical protein